MRWIFRAALAFLAVGILGAVGTATYAMTAPPYLKVQFGVVIGGCDRNSDTLYLDRTTGEQLACVDGSTPGGAPDPGAETAGAFVELTPEEFGRITARAEAAAADGGISDAEQVQITALVDDLARQHGFNVDRPATEPVARVLIAALPIGVLLGIVSAVGNRRAKRNARDLAREYSQFEQNRS